LPALDATDNLTDSTGRLIAGTRAGTFADGISVIGSKNGMTATASVSVTVLPEPPKRLEIVPETLALGVDETQRLAATALDEDGNKVTDIGLPSTSMPEWERQTPRESSRRAPPRVPSVMPSWSWLRGTVARSRRPSTLPSCPDL
jgi:hypothetical protein